MKINNLLWDLDGTLTDPKIGIIQSIQYALNKFGAISPPPEELLWCIGPPLYESFKELVPGCTQENILNLVDLYRERFSTIGLYENEVFPGISNLLAELQFNKKHYLATSKPHIFARKILNHFNLNSFFSAIHGSELNGIRSDKSDLIKYIIDNEGLNPSNTLMIGDRKHDIHGAKKSGLISVGIKWGYGSHEEHLKAGADYIFNNIDQLKEFLISV